MILCVNLNAALDRTLVVSPFHKGSVNRSTETLVQAGGKACNLARILKVLKIPSKVIGCTGGFSGEYIEALLKHDGVPAQWIRIKGESRTCTTLVDPSSQQVTDIYEPGPALDAQQLRLFEQHYQRLLPEASWVALTGSLPPGVPVNYYSHLTALAHQAQKPVLLDASGAALRSGITAQPEIVKPNLDELSQLTDTDKGSIKAVHHAASQLAIKYGVYVIVTLGRQGALLAFGNKLWKAYPPSIESLSATGSGDALAAGFLSGLTNGKSLPNALRAGVAAGAANTLVLGAGRMLKSDFERLYSEINCTEIVTTA